MIPYGTLPGFSHLLEVVTHFEFILLCGDVRLNLRVGIVDDGQEHVEQDEEYEEDIEDEVCRPQYTVRFLQLVEVEVTQNDSEQGEPGVANTGLFQ